MGSTLGDLAVARVASANAAAAAGECPRLDQVQGLLAGKAAASHAHGTGDVTGFGEAVEDAVADFLANTQTLEWSYDDGAGTLSASVRLKTGGGLAADSDGIRADVGTGSGQVAAGDHTHGQLHDAATASGTATVDLGVAGQRFYASARLRAGGGLTATASGLAADVGTGSGQVAAGNHTHGQLHDAVTVTDTATVDLTLTGQALAAAVRLDATPGAGKIALRQGSSGLYIPAAESGVAPWAHGHANATASEAGFMSPEDKRSLDLYAPLAQASQTALFSRHDFLVAGKYVGGRHRWEQDMEVVSVTVTANAPAAATTMLGLELDGTVVDLLGLPAGSANTEVFAAKAYGNVFLAAGAYMRWRCASGVAAGAEDAAASMLNISVSVRPALGTIPSVSVNCGGSAAGGFASDAYYSGGAAASTATAPNTAGVTSPAPAAVYQSCRKVSGATTALVYTLTGLARGIDYLVRLHFCEFIWSSVGDQLMNVSVAGATTYTTYNYDILGATGGVRNKGTVLEYTVKADANGRIKVSLQPLIGGDGNYHCSVNGIECARA